MDFLESMTIEQLVSLNQDIQKVLKEKRKKRKITEQKFGNNVKIGEVNDDNGEPIEYFLAIRQRYVPDCFITVLSGKPNNFEKEFKEFANTIMDAYEYFKDAED